MTSFLFHFLKQRQFFRYLIFIYLTQIKLNTIRFILVCPFGLTLLTLACCKYLSGKSESERSAFYHRSLIGNSVWRAERLQWLHGLDFLSRGTKDVKCDVSVS